MVMKDHCFHWAVNMWPLTPIWHVANLSSCRMAGTSLPCYSCLIVLHSHRYMFICSRQDHDSTSYGLLTNSTTISKLTKHVDLVQRLMGSIINQDLKSDATLQPLCHIPSQRYCTRPGGRRQSVGEEKTRPLRTREDSCCSCDLKGEVHLISVKICLIKKTKTQPWNAFQREVGLSENWCNPRLDS